MSTNPTTDHLAEPRLATINLGQLGIDKRHVAALLEVDVTRARLSIRSSNRGAHSSVSFLAWLVKSIAATLSVPVSVVVERMVDDRRYPFPVAIHGAATSNLGDIERSIQRARIQKIDAATIVSGDRRLGRSLFRLLPGFVRARMISRAVRKLHRENAQTDLTGTPRVTVTPAGMGGRIKGWFIPRVMNAVSIGVGAVTQKAVVVNGAISPREVLHLAFVVDQEQIDTTVSSRWIGALVRGMEAGRELSVN
jgi:hypothetical protein